MINTRKSHEKQQTTHKNKVLVSEHKTKTIHRKSDSILKIEVFLHDEFGESERERERIVL